jgi:tRNA threonylcarbamoyladenosine biosynthesis protein TsaB
VGASTAKGICYALDIPLLSIDTLKIIAQPLTQEISDDMKILATIDARRDEIYYNIYDKSLNELQKTESHILSPDSFLHYRSGGLYVTGDGTDKTRNILTESGDESFKYRPSYPSAKYMSALAYKKYISKQFEDIAYYSPFYMKPPNITTRKKPLF